MLQLRNIAPALLTLASAFAHASSDLQPDTILRLPESVPVVFIADTSKAQFHRYERNGDGVILAASYFMSIGRAGAGKQRAGDRRTPIGAYFVTEQLDTSRLHEKYGVTAFPLDYPNAWDRRLERTGDGIWVHGVDPNGGERPAYDTDGCIALPNADLLALETTFLAGTTPVIVVEQASMNGVAESALLADQLEQAVNEWANSIASGDMYAYLSFYDPEFSRWSMNVEEWHSFALQTIGTQVVDDVVISDLLLLRYPGEGQLFISRFRERVIAEDSEVDTVRRLYWRRNSEGEFRIVAEDDG